MRRANPLPRQSGKGLQYPGRGSGALVKAAEKGEPWAIRELMDRIDGKVPQATILQGDEETPIRYVEVPRKATNAEEWIASQVPALACAASDKLN
jgi:hypothetical protein